jgi:HEPN domain-containing protein
MNPSHEAAASLLEKARGDRRAFLSLADDPEVPTWIAGFHAQQAVEKSLKSVLVSVSVEYPRTHNLSMLIGLLGIQNTPLPPDNENLSELTPFGTAFRYEDASPASQEIPFNRERVSQFVDRTLRWAEIFLSKIGIQ